MLKFGPDSDLSDLEFEKYMKTKPAEAVQIDEPFEVDTLEGEGLSGKAGDYLMRGVKGELYPCDREIFEQTYASESRLSELESEILDMQDDYTDGFEDGYGEGLRHGHAQAERGESLPAIFDEHIQYERKPTRWHRERAAELEAERDRLQGFIDYVRNCNDGMGATARMLDKIDALESEVESLRRQMAGAKKACNYVRGDRDACVEVCKSLRDKIDMAIEASENGSASDAIQDMLFILQGDTP